MRPSTEKSKGTSSRRPRRGLWINPTNPARHLSDTQEKRRQVYRAIDYAGFDWQVYLVTASGFLTDSYNLFATNVILPSIAFVYWPRLADDANHSKETAINTVTLAGSAVGQLLFGYLADRYGRRKLYGLELILVIVSTLGLAQASDGFGVPGQSSMNILGWLLFYRLFQGIGIGAEYPLSAVICAEFAPVTSRARMMAAVFLMQPVGQTLAAIIGLGVAYAYRSQIDVDIASTDQTPQSVAIAVDSVWRWVIGVGTIPAMIAILFRLTIPESPRYTLDVDEDADRALDDAKAFYPASSNDLSAENGQMPVAQPAADDDDNDSLAIRSFRLDDPVSPGQSPAASISDQLETDPSPSKAHFWSGLRDYLFRRGNWRRLAGASLCWAILDFAYYGLGINSPRTIAKIWASQPQSAPNGTVAANSWSSGLFEGTDSLTSDGQNMFYVLRNESIRSIVTSCLGSLLGSVILIKLIPYVPRRAVLYWSFGVLFALMLLIGATLFAVFETGLHAPTIALYILTQFVFNVGPNTLLFVIPAEIFPTRYRATCYGISSAAGKVSSVVVQAFLPSVMAMGGAGDGPGRGTFNDQTSLAIILIVFAALMLPGAWIAWLWIPEVQCTGAEARHGFTLPSKTLEELAEEDDKPRETRDGASRPRRRWIVGNKAG